MARYAGREVLGLPRQEDTAPAGTQSLKVPSSNPAGSRAYKLFIPSDYHGKPLPLVGQTLHGCTQSPDDFAAGTRMNFIAEEQGCFVVYPAQSSNANPSKCWNWFRAADQHRDKGEPSLIAGITRQVMQEYSIDPEVSLCRRSFGRGRRCGHHGCHLQ